MDNKAVYNYLLAHDIKPSVQRLAIMDYLAKHQTHPSADEIYNALTAKIPTLSKTTVYNTLRLFVQQGAAKLLTIDERNVHFDSVVAPHAHFLCQCCGKLFDLPADELLAASRDNVPEGFSVESMELYYRGTCKGCAKN